MCIQSLWDLDLDLDLDLGTRSWEREDPISIFKIRMIGCGSLVTWFVGLGFECPHTLPTPYYFVVLVVPTYAQTHAPCTGDTQEHRSTGTSCFIPLSTGPWAIPRSNNQAAGGGASLPCMSLHPLHVVEVQFRTLTTNHFRVATIFLDVRHLLFWGRQSCQSPIPPDLLPISASTPAYLQHRASNSPAVAFLFPVPLSCWLIHRFGVLAGVETW